MDLDVLYEELSGVSEQKYTNTSRIYWHGNTRDNLAWIKATAISGETVPLAWVSNSFEYAIGFASFEGAVYQVRQTGALNIWNPCSDKDWNALAREFPQFNVGDTRNVLINYDWLSIAYIRAGKLRKFTRNELLEAIKSLKYDGVFNKEGDIPGRYPALGLFLDSAPAGYFRVLDRYKWDKNDKVWRSVGHPKNVYDPAMSRFKTLEESDSNPFLYVGEYERQNFLEGYI